MHLARKETVEPPYPVPSSMAKRRAMQSQRRRETAPEMALRRELHRLGLRYRLHQRPLVGLRRTIDIVFPSRRVAVEIRGCFWHGCRLCKRLPKANAAWWEWKIARNRTRDADTESRFRAAAWQLFVFWEHDSVETVAERIQAAVRTCRWDRAK